MVSHSKTRCVITYIIPYHPLSLLRWLNWASVFTNTGRITRADIPRVQHLNINRDIYYSMQTEGPKICWNIEGIISSNKSEYGVYIQLSERNVPAVYSQWQKAVSVILWQAVIWAFIPWPAPIFAPFYSWKEKTNAYCIDIVLYKFTQ